MTDINRVVLTGRLTKDVEIRKTQSGLSVASFTIASNGRQDETAFINCVAWRQSADFLGQYAHKGDMVGIDGRISTRNYERDGQRVYITEVVADAVSILSKKGNNEGQGNTHQQQNPSQNAPKQQSMMNGFGTPITIDESDLPF